MQLTAVDLFAGAGGLSLGLASAGFRLLFAVDDWKVAVDSYRENFRHSIYLEDLSMVGVEELAVGAHLRVGDLDLLAGGPPCQGFSIQRIGRDADDRNNLVLNFARAAIALQPRMLLMENVPGLLGQRGRHILAAFASILSLGSYGMLVTRVDADQHGVPQKRSRVLVYGWRGDVPPYSPSLHHAPASTVWEAIGDLPPADPPGTAVARDPLHVASRLSELNRERLRHIPPGGGFEDLPRELRVDCHRPGTSVIGHRGVYGRLHPHRPAGVITARFDSFTRGRFAHPYEDRNLTLREGARLQTFPDDFALHGNREQVAAQIGNAFPPRLAAAVGRDLARHLSGDTAEGDDVLSSPSQLRLL